MKARSARTPGSLPALKEGIILSVAFAITSVLMFYIYIYILNTDILPMIIKINIILGKDG